MFLLLQSKKTHLGKYLNLEAISYNLKMALENEVTIVTDFDKTMVKQNSPIHLVRSLLWMKPKDTLSELGRALQRFGPGGRGFLEFMLSMPELERELAIAEVVRELQFKPSWIAELQLLLKKYPFKNVRIIVITRNLERLARYFIEAHLGELERYIGKGRGVRWIAIGNTDLPEEVRRSHKGEKIGFAGIIDRSIDKVPFIRADAIYFGDEEEYKELVKHPKLRKMRFHLV